MSTTRIAWKHTRGLSYGFVDGRPRYVVETTHPHRDYIRADEVARAMAASERAAVRLGLTPDAGQPLATRPVRSSSDGVTVLIQTVGGVA